MTTLYITDLDGTLLSPESKVTSASAQLLNESIDRGALFSVATARTPATVSKLLEDVKMNIPAVVMTGAALWHPGTNRYGHTRFMHPDTVCHLLRLYRKAGVPSFFYTLRDHHIHIYHIGDLSVAEREFLSQRDNSPFKTSHIDPSGACALPREHDKVLLFYAMQPTLPTERLYERIRAEVADCSPVFYHDMYGPDMAILEVFSPQATKAIATRTLAESLGVDRIVAFGDNVNDLPLLRAADVAVAVGNAIPEVKNEADVIIDTNARDSVARFIAEDYRNNH